MIIYDAIPHERVDGTNPYNEYEFGEVRGSLENVYETIKLEYEQLYNALLIGGDIISFHRVKKQYSYPILINIIEINENDNNPIKGYHFIKETNSSIQLIPAKAQTFYNVNSSNTVYFEDLNEEHRNIKVILPRITSR